MSCLLAGAAMIALSGGSFSLHWTHSVERIEWREEWSITQDGLTLTRAAVKGSGAGMEPGPDARPEDGWWVWQPDLPPQPELLLAASGATLSGWTLCSGGRCVEVGAEPGVPIRLRPCPP